MRMTIIGRKKHRTFTAVTVVFLAAMLIIALSAAMVSKRESGGLQTAKRSEEAGVYAVICVGFAQGEVYELEKELFEGFGIRATFFVTSRGLETDAQKAKEMISFGNALGVYCENADGMSRYELLRLLALENDAFYEFCGRRPRFCLTDGSYPSYAAEAAYIYGQKAVSYSVKILTGDEIIKNGDVVLCAAESKDALYAFARAVSRAASNGLMPVTLAALYDKNG